MRIGPRPVAQAALSPAPARSGRSPTQKLTPLPRRHPPGACSPNDGCGGSARGDSSRFELIIMVKENTDKDDGVGECPLTSELSENKLRYNFRLGDITWVKHSDSSWWPAQVIDEACVSGKPKKKAKHDVLVRLYGTCQYLYVDPWKSNAEFEMMLKQENKSAMETFHEVIEKELSHVKSPCDYDEEAVNTKGKTSSRKVRKREGLKRSGRRGVKESATTEGLGDKTEQRYGAKQDQEVGSTATTGVAVLKGRKLEGVRQPSPTHGKEQAIDKASSENPAEGLRDKTQKHISLVQDKDGNNMATEGTLVVRREGLRRSTRINTKEYLDAAEDITSQLSDTSACEDGTEVGNRTSESQNHHKDDAMVDGTWAPDAEIRNLVRDTLFSDIIARQRAAEMAYVDDVIKGICDATEENMTGGATAATKGGRGIKRNGSRAEAESCNGTQRLRKVDKVTRSQNEATEDPMQVTNPETMSYHITKNNNSKGNDSDSLEGIIDTTPSRDAATAELGQLSARQIRIMQSLALIAPSGSPFGRNVLVAATHRQF